MDIATFVFDAAAGDGPAAGAGYPEGVWAADGAGEPASTFAERQPPREHPLPSATPAAARAAQPRGGERRVIELRAPDAPRLRALPGRCAQRPPQVGRPGCGDPSA